MINWFDMPAEGLSNGGLFEVKELEVTENGTYETKGEMYNKVTVNVEGGGSSWQTVFEGSVTTDTYMEELNAYSGYIADTQITGDSIKVTFNGNEYILPKTEYGYGAINEDSPDFNEYPIYIATGEDGTTLLTQTAGTYTLKIEEEQSGGSSDFSTAEVSVVDGDVKTNMPVCMNDPEAPVGYYLTTLGGAFDGTLEEGVYTTVLYKGALVCSCVNIAMGGSISLSGDCEWVNEEDGLLLITGDCTITIS